MLEMFNNRLYPIMPIYNSGNDNGKDKQESSYDYALYNGAIGQPYPPHTKLRTIGLS